MRAKGSLQGFQRPHQVPPQFCRESRPRSVDLEYTWRPLLCFGLGISPSPVAPESSGILTKNILSPLWHDKA